MAAELCGSYDRARAAAMEREIQRLVLSALGVAARYVWVVPERWIVKSTAGKISRRETRVRFASELSAGRRESMGKGAGPASQD